MQIPTILKNSSKQQQATAIAIFFHAIGLGGILFYDGLFFIRATPFNLLLSFALLLWTQQDKNRYFYCFMTACLFIGFLVEVVGVNTGLLFGNYSYGAVLGVQWRQVPLLIGINWFITLYCCGIAVHTLLMKAINSIAADSRQPPMLLKALSVMVDGASLAVAFDWLMEPVAVKLGFWQWLGDGAIPLYNYICWFVVSLLLLGFFHVLQFNKQNKFAVNLLLIQGLFFLVLRTFMK